MKVSATPDIITHQPTINHCQPNEIKLIQHSYFYSTAEETVRETKRREKKGNGESVKTVGSSKEPLKGFLLILQQAKLIC